MGRGVVAGLLWAGIGITICLTPAAPSAEDLEPVATPFQAQVIADFFRPPLPTKGPDRTPQRIPRPKSLQASGASISSSGTSLRGTASYYDSWCKCNAMTDQRWRGQKVTITGPVGTRVVTINDAGPVPSLHRVADLSVSVFQAVCGPLSKGICTVTITGP